MDDRKNNKKKERKKKKIVHRITWSSFVDVEAEIIIDRIVDSKVTSLPHFKRMEGHFTQVTMIIDNVGLT